jgi:hypothetical protein
MSFNQAQPRGSSFDSSMENIRRLNSLGLGQLGIDSVQILQLQISDLYHRIQLLDDSSTTIILKATRLLRLMSHFLFRPCMRCSGSCIPGSDTCNSCQVILAREEEDRMRFPLYGAGLPLPVAEPLRFDDHANQGVIHTRPPYQTSQRPPSFDHRPKARSGRSPAPAAKPHRRRLRSMSPSRDASRSSAGRSMSPDDSTVKSDNLSNLTVVSSNGFTAYTRRPSTMRSYSPPMDPELVESTERSRQRRPRASHTRAASTRPRDRPEDRTPSPHALQRMWLRHSARSRSPPREAILRLPQ